MNQTPGGHDGQAYPPYQPYHRQTPQPPVPSTWDHHQSISGPSSRQHSDYDLSRPLSQLSFQDPRIQPNTPPGGSYNPPNHPHGLTGVQPTGVESIPAPLPKVPYQPPVFRTFQERKRMKEMARMQGDVYTPPGDRISLSSSSHTSLSSMGNPVGHHSASSSPIPLVNVAVAPHEILTHSHTPSPPPPSIRPTYTGNSTTQGQARPLPLPTPRPLPGSPVLATVERSDTLSSVKSLDRQGFSSGRRPLPKTPVGVNSSRSLDRGIPLRSEGRKQPSIVGEEDESEGSSSPLPTIVTPPIIEEPSRSPAKFMALPTFNLPPSEDTEEESASSSGVAFSGLPIISVSSEVPTPEHIQPNSALICAKCGQSIIGRIVNAMKRRWHPQCFGCNECGELLEHVSSYEWEGKAYCHLDYHDKFAYRCYQCKTPIIDSRFVTLNDPTLGERYYHELHFFCSECGDPFLDPSKSSSAGAEKTDEDDEGETNPFVIQKGHPYCEKCHLRLHKPKCKKCAQPIPDLAVNAMGAKWHAECFVCDECGQGFANNLFFPKEGKALCTSCWEGHL